MSSLNIWTLVGFLGAAQALVVGIALITTKSLLRKVFGLLLIDLGVGMAAILYSHLNRGRAPLFTNLVEIAVGLLAPVLLYAFVMIVAELDWKRRFTVHALPPALWIGYAAILVISGEAEALRVPPIRLVVGYQMVYTALSIYRLITIKRGAEEVTSSAIGWARITVLFMVLIHVAQVVRSLFGSSAPRDIVPITSGVAVIVLTFVAARHAHLFSSAPSNGMEREDEKRSPKYSGSSLTDDQAESGLERFLRAMETDRAYLRSDLTLSDLARELGVARTHLSQLVNERCGKSFLEAVADYRVREAAGLLADSDLQHLTVEAIGLRAGFQSKSAFYAAFRKRHEETPATYRRQQAGEAAAGLQRS